MFTAFCRLEIVGFDTYPYPEGLKQKIFDISETGTVQEICLYNVLLGKLFAEAAKRVCVKCEILLESVLVIGSHGYVLVCVILESLMLIVKFSLLQIGTVKIHGVTPQGIGLCQCSSF